MRSERSGLAVWARRVIARLLPWEDRALLDELDELHAERAAASGRATADGWYVRQAAGFVTRLAAKRLARGLRSLFAGVHARIAVRSLVGRPLWLIGFVATIAIGVGGLASVYAAANWVLLRPVPGIETTRDLFTLRLGSSEAPAHVSWPISQQDLEEFRSGLPAALDLAGATPVEVHVVAADGTASRIAAEIVSPNYFTLLGVRLDAGAGFASLPAPAADVVIVSGGLARDANVRPGDEIRVNGRAIRVVGIAPAEFRGAELPGRARLWFPLGALPLLDPTAPANASARPGYGVWSLLYGRLRPGLTAAHIETQANTLMEQIRARGPSTFMALHYRMQAYDGIGANPTVRDSLRSTLRLLGAAALFLLGLALANVVNLAAMEASARRGAASIRLALGARRISLFSQWTLEGAVLGILGAIVAVVMATLLAEGFRQMRLADYGASLADLRIEPRVLAFTGLIALVASVMAGLPIALATGRDETLARVGRSRTGASGGRRLRDVLVAMQVALSLVLVVAAGLLMRTVANLRASDPGFAVDGLTVFSIDPALGGYGEESPELLRRIEDRMAGTGIRAGFVLPAPLRANWITISVFAEPAMEDEDRVVGARFHATPSWIRTLDPDVIAGRSDFELATDEVIVTRNLAARAFPNAAPATLPGRLLHVPRDRAYRIAAVIEDVHLDGLPGEPPPTVILPLHAEALAFGAVTGWTRGSLDITAVRSAIHAEAPDLPLFDAAPARRAIDLLSAERIVMARIFTLLAGLGLLLSAVGLYGALGRAVAERMREFGVRAALGASPGRLLRNVAMRGLLLAGIGCAIGFLGAFGAGRALQSRLFGVQMLDPFTYVGGIGLVLASAVLASLVPAWRATFVPVERILREE